jgi:hypothetical protein
MACWQDVQRGSERSSLAEPRAFRHASTIATASLLLLLVALFAGDYSLSPCSSLVKLALRQASSAEKQ